MYSTIGLWYMLLQGVSCSFLLTHTDVDINKTINSMNEKLSNASISYQWVYFKENQHSCSFANTMTAFGATADAMTTSGATADTMIQTPCDCCGFKFISTTCSNNTISCMNKMFFVEKCDICVQSTTSTSTTVEQPTTSSETSTTTLSEVVSSTTRQTSTSTLNCQWGNFSDWGLCLPEDVKCEQWSQYRITENCTCNSTVDTAEKIQSCGLPYYHVQSCNITVDAAACNDYWKFDNWTECRRLNQSNDEVENCGEGYKTKKSDVCINSVEDSSIEQCDYQPFLVSNCTKHCSEDCAFEGDNWGDWGECEILDKSETCGNGFTFRNSTRCVCSIDKEEENDKEEQNDISICGAPPFQVYNCYVPCIDVCEKTRAEEKTVLKSNSVFNINDSNQMFIKEASFIDVENTATIIQYSETAADSCFSEPARVNKNLQPIDGGADYSYIYKYIPPVLAMFIKADSTVDLNIMVEMCHKGFFGEWSDFGECNGENCAEFGIKNKTRTCYSDDKKMTEIHEKYCVGLHIQLGICDLQCYIFENWSAWNITNTTDNLQSYHRNRVCYHVEKSHVAATCSNVDNATKSELQAMFQAEGQLEENKCYINAKITHSSYCGGDAVVNFTVTHWSNWTDCDYGEQTRRRICHDQSSCDGIDLNQSNSSCILNDDGYKWDVWVVQDICSKSCGGGKYLQTRQCMSGYCIGDTTQYVDCNIYACPINGNWTAWSIWLPCSTTCNKGQQKRYRECNNPRASFGGMQCIGNQVDTKECNEASCTDLYLSNAAYPSCQSYCKHVKLSCSYKYDKLSIVDASSHFSFVASADKKAWADSSHPICYDSGDSYTCEGYQGILKDTYNCTDVPSNVDAVRLCNCILQENQGFEGWMEWGECNQPCDVGTRDRYRECEDDEECADGRIEDTGICFFKQCPKDGVWTGWQPWEECSATCGPSSRRIRRRYCEPPINGGRECVGLSFDVEYCKDIICPVNGGWNIWEEWTHCETPCYRGVRTRSRRCNKPSPDFNGAYCQGLPQQTLSCSHGPCSYVTLDVLVTFTDEEYHPLYSFDEKSRGFFKTKLLQTIRKAFPNARIKDVAIHSLKNGDGITQNKN